ncbi:MAG: hypothetical protein AB7I30_23070 [Isosphaeraceae bacterium]
MIEPLAIPAWNTPPRTLQDWVDTFESLGLTPRTMRESPSAWWIEVPSAGLRGYAVTRGDQVEAINFEIDPGQLDQARARLAAVAEALGWELHDEDDDEDDDEE